LWLSVASAGLAALAIWTSTRPGSTSPPRGSGNVADDQRIGRLTGQVLELLGYSGVPAGRLKCMAPCPQIGLDPGADEAGARQALHVSERVLMSTGYAPQLSRLGGQYVISIQRGASKPPSIDRPL
jgi:hypothetical protein